MTNVIKLDVFNKREQEEFDNILHEFYTLNDMNIIVEDRESKIDDKLEKINQLWEKIK